MSPLDLTKVMTLAERERLELLTEECSEVIQAATKILRHGYESKYENGIENRRQLEIEMGDVDWAVRCMVMHGDVDRDVIQARSTLEKPMKARPWLHHTTT